MSAPEGIRTPNLLIRSQMLYPLSYGRRSSVMSRNLWRRREDLNLRSPVRGQLISSESHSAALARLPLDFLRLPDTIRESPNRRRHSVHSGDICCRSDCPPTARAGRAASLCSRQDGAGCDETGQQRDGVRPAAQCSRRHRASDRHHQPLSRQRLRPAQGGTRQASGFRSSNPSTSPSAPARSACASSSFRSPRRSATR